MTAQDRGDPVRILRGRVSSNTNTQIDDYAIGVLFARVIYPNPSAPQDPSQRKRTRTLETEFVRGTVVGDFPANFQVELPEAPSAYPIEFNIIRANLDGTTATGPFYLGNDPDAVRIGNLVFGPKAELDALPSQIEFTPSRTPGSVLIQHLPSTTVSHYQVVYAQGVAPGDTLYPTFHWDGSSGGTAITDGYTVVDGQEHYQSVAWEECRGEVALTYQTRPEYLACLSTNSGRITCEDGCFGNEGVDPYACLEGCAATFPGQLSKRECLLQVSRAEVESTCGLGRGPGADQMHVLPSNAQLSLTLGVDDIKTALWFVHPTLAPLPGQ